MAQFISKKKISFPPLPATKDEAYNTPHTQKEKYKIRKINHVIDEIKKQTDFYTHTHTQVKVQF